MTTPTGKMPRTYWRIWQEKLRGRTLSEYLRLPESEIITELCRQHSEAERGRIKRLLTAAAETGDSPSPSARFPRIVLTNHGLDELAGSELWVRDVAEYLVSNQIEVAVYSRRLGPVAQRLAASNILVTSSIDEVERFRPELIHINHSREAKALFEHFRDTDVRFVNMVHGVLPGQEVPQFVGIDQYMCVSIATKAHVSLMTGARWDEIELVPNFFDQHRFQLSPNPADQKRAVVFSHNSRGAQVNELRSQMRRFGYELDQLGTGSNRCDAPEHVLGNYDVVFAVGRSAVEALACGCSVILWDDGVVGQTVTPENFWQCVQANFALFAKLIPYCFADEQRAAEWIDEQLSRLTQSARTALTAQAHEYLALANVGKLLLRRYQDTMRREKASDTSESFLRSELELARNDVEEKTQLIEQLHARLESDGNELNRLRRELDDGTQAMRQLHATLQSMEGSRSWRLTRPLRALRSWLTSIRLAARPLRKSD